MRNMTQKKYGNRVRFRLLLEDSLSYGEVPLGTIYSLGNRLKAHLS